MAAEKLSKFKAFKAVKEDDRLDYGPLAQCYYDVADSSTWDYAMHPLCQCLEECGYYDIQVIHLPTGERQMASYNPKMLDQKSLKWNKYKVRTIDEAGMISAEERVTEVENDWESLKSFSKAGASAGFTSLKKKGFFFDGSKWKIIQGQEKDGEKGPVMVGTGKLLKPLTLAGYKQQETDDGKMWWRQVDDAGNDIGEWEHSPKLDVQAGKSYTVTTDYDFFYRAMGAFLHHYNEATWTEHYQNVLGWKCEVQSLEDGGHIAMVKSSSGSETVWAVPVQCLGHCKGETTLVVGEIGQYVMVAYSDTFDSDTHSARTTNTRPIYNEFISIVQCLAEKEEKGWVETNGEEGDWEHYDNLRPGIKAWLEENQDWEYDA